MEASAGSIGHRLDALWRTPRTFRGTLGTVDHETLIKRYLVTAALAERMRS